LAIANQTLAIVQNLNVSGTGNVSGAQIYEQFPAVTLAQTNLYAGQTANIVTMARLGSANVVNATCRLWVYGQDLNGLVNASMMMPVSDMYVVNWSVPIDAVGQYVAKVNCTGGSFGSAVIGDFKDVVVNGGMTAVVKG
jgi:hypothetical protein